MVAVDEDAGGTLAAAVGRAASSSPAARSRWLPRGAAGRPWRMPRTRDVFLILLCAPVASIFLLSLRQHWVDRAYAHGPKCIGWHATQACLAFG